ncbi:hypothetical protein [Robbsia andropogonis]|nr:hypothetical protein [Robbsia andropogonis]
MWQEAGAIHTDNGYFVVVPGALEKPLDAIRSKHRTRTLRKRQLKTEINAEIQKRVRELFGLQDESPWNNHPIASTTPTQPLRQ